MTSLVQIQDPDDIIRLQRFLEANNLPWQDVATGKASYWGHLDSQGELIGSGALEFYSTAALLRSVAVHNKMRGQLLGKQIVEELITKAGQRKISSVYLLTETAREFFLKRGFEDIPRSEAPEDLRLSSEFSYVCPTSAACMIYRIAG